MKYIEQGTEFLDQLKDKVHEQQWEIERLNKENNILKKNAEHNDKVVDNVNWENMLLKKRNHKAIEYCKELMLFKKNSRQYLIGKSMLNILQGGDKE